jgi:hypothetical protein
MCIIIYNAPNKRKRKKLAYSTLATLWQGNPDGAGYWVEREDGDVFFSKGFFDLASFMKAILAEDLTGTNRYAIHFRWASVGEVKPSLCHPFTAENGGKWWQLKGLSSRVVMHNGTLPIPVSAGRSDTAEYVASRLSKMGGLCDPASVKKIASETAGSRMLLYDKGKVTMTGAWVEKNGYYFSNTRGAWVYENQRYC